MDSYNVLLLSIGRRVELVNCFMNAAKKLNIHSVIWGGDCSDTAPALYFADKACILPSISSPNYINSIIDICKRNNIALIIPTIDTDLLLLSRNKETIESLTSAKLVISDERMISVCQNKVDTQKFLESNGFNMPYMYTENELNKAAELPYPLFIKPQEGSSSINTFVVRNSDELSIYRRIIDRYIVQDYIEGKEFTVDTFSDFDGRIITIVPRLRLSTRSGEISKGRIIKDKEIINEIERLLTILNPIGPITIQCMKTKRGIEFIEINPRFGGGAPMSIASGANSCENLYKLLMGQKLKYNDNYIDKLLYLRFDSSICLNEKMDVVSL